VSEEPQYVISIGGYYDPATEGNGVDQLAAKAPEQKSTPRKPSVNSQSSMRQRGPGEQLEVCPCLDSGECDDNHLKPVLRVTHPINQTHRVKSAVPPGSPFHFEGAEGPAPWAN
jgi:hypothetical protein